MIDAVLMVILLSACASLPMHTSVPESLSNQASVTGFPEHIRFWADEAPSNIGTLVKERLAAYRAANQMYYQKHKAYPALHYLAISGGASDGAYGAGLLNGWSETGERPDFAIVTGVSTGALIAPFVFIGPQYDAKIKELFTTTSSKDIFKGNVWSVLNGIFGGLALTDDTPLAQKIEESITPKIMAEIAAEHRKGKRLFIGTTNLEAQRGMIWDIGAIALSNHPEALKLIHKIMLASASIPGIFSPVSIDVTAGGNRYNEIHTDGGVISQVFIYPLKLQRSVIDEFVHYHMERHLYIIRNSKVTPQYELLEPGLFAITTRSINTLGKYQGIGDLFRIYVGSQRDGVSYNLSYIPADFSAESTELFDPAYMRKLFHLGYQIGKQPKHWMKKPPGVDYVPSSPKDHKNIKARITTRGL
jgi:predicted acylesterase/phospholipase RssA